MTMRIGITMGDPAGIGPEVLLKALEHPAVREQADLLVLGDAATLRRAAEQMHLNFPHAVVPSSTPLEELPPGVAILDFANAPDAPPRRPSRALGLASLQYIHRAIDLALTGEIGAIVTAPVNKQALLMAGSHLAGHTEILAQRTRTKRPVMMLAGERLRVALVTTHLALKKVPGALTIEGIASTIKITAQSLHTLFGIARPRVAVCALNPHASDGGRFGNEEARIIEPAIEKARTSRFDLSGPRPADAAFFQAAAGRYDAVVAMYHDQGLGPLKLLHFDDAVNITLGLPIIRTSVDHGTAYDIAGQGEASPGSMIAALRLAVQFANAKQQAAPGDTLPQ